jgi:uncharacterized protein (DUF342 family)
MSDPSQGFGFIRTYLRWRNHPEGAQVEIVPNAAEIDEQDMFRAFAAAGILNANTATICNLIRQKETGWQRVGKPFEFRDASVSPVLEVRKTDLVASVRIDPAMALEQGREIPPEEVKALLAKVGVSHGIDAGLVGMLLEPGCPAGWYDIAAGEPPVKGTDTVIECRVQMDNGLPVPHEDGSIDFRDRGDLPEIAEGTPIYVRIPGEPAKDGIDLSGRPIPAVKGLDAKLIPGPNMRFREGDPEVVEAACDGYLLRGRDGRIQVGKVFEVKGDLDLSVGNIKYHGPVQIGGNVPAGFRINAGGDVVIRGTAEGSDIRSTGGSVQIQGGVFGGRIEAAGDIAVAFAHEATLLAGGDLQGGKYLQHCNARCTNLKFANGGMFVGGQALASREIECDVLGTEAGSATIVQLSDPEEEEARSDLERVATEEKRLAPLHDLLEQKVVVLKTRMSGGGQLLGHARDDAEELLRQYSAVMEKIRELGRRRARDQEVLALERTRTGSISVRRKIHPGVEVHIFGRRFDAQTCIPPVRLVARNREVEASKF